MPLIVETGVGVPDANSLCTREFADEYFLDRDIQDWGSATEAKRDAALIRATDYMELVYQRRWIGTLSPFATTLSWPRDHVYDSRGVLVTHIPRQVKMACAELALRALASSLVAEPPITPDGKFVTMIRKKVGPIEKETEFQSGFSKVVSQFPIPIMLLAPWVYSHQGTVYR